MDQFYMGIAFGEMDLSPFTYYGLFIVGITFVVSFGLSSIPLAKNMQSNKDKKK